jgi:nicotinate phosphoribosyltransferase
MGNDNNDDTIMRESDLGLFLDYYELTSGKADFDSIHNGKITESYFFRKVPSQLGSYAIFAGLEQVIKFVLNYRVSEDDLAWLARTSGNDFSEEFLAYLKNFRFSGDVYAVPEGTVIFPNEPVLIVTGPSIDVQLFETYILNVINFQTLVATKAARMVTAAAGKTVLEFGSRRAHGRDAALIGARAAHIGGCVGSALVLAGKKFGIPYVGTLPHKFIQERDSELEAFRDYAKSFPHNTILLIDTYDTIRGARNACIVGKELRSKGFDLKGVRIDSGDLLSLSKEVRKILDSEGFKDTKIYVSSDLDEYAIEELTKSNAPIDSYGVGTRLITGANYNSVSKTGEVSALGGVYKLVQVEKDGKPVPKMKLTNDIAKATLPGMNTVLRKSKDGLFVEDEIAPWGTKPGNDQLELLTKVVSGSRLQYAFPSVPAIKEYCTEQLASLPKDVLRITDPKPYTVRINKAITDLQTKIRTEILQSTSQ